VRSPRIGLLHRRLRQRARLTQEQLGGRAGLGRSKIGRIEAGDLERLRQGDIERSFAALGARVELRVLYNGAAADRVPDELHARLVGMFVRVLRRYGWEARVEVSFSEFGERGSIDILAWHAATRALLVVEVKSELAAVEGTLRPMDVKHRPAAKVVSDRFGWRPRLVARVLVLPDERTARRAVERHSDCYARPCLRLRASCVAG
jgi:transcriptional regulator with XRE-family HTH domain